MQTETSFVYKETPEGTFNTVCASSKPKNGYNLNMGLFFYVPKKKL